MRGLRRRNEEERHHLGGTYPVAVQGPAVRPLDVARLRREVPRSAVRAGLVVLEARPGRASHTGAHPAPQVRAHVEPVAARAAGGRDPPCGARGRHPPAPRRGGPDRRGRRACDRLAHRQKRAVGRVAAPDGAHRAAARARVRRRRRDPQGREDHVARHPHPALPVPRAGQHLRAHRHEAPAGGRQTTTRDRRRAGSCRGRRLGRAMAGLIQPVGTGLRGIPRGEKHARRRQRERHAPKARQGQAHDPQAHPRGGTCSRSSTRTSRPWGRYRPRTTSSSHGTAACATCCDTTAGCAWSGS